VRQGDSHNPPKPVRLEQTDPKRTSDREIKEFLKPPTVPGVRPNLPRKMPGPPPRKMPGPPAMVKKPTPLPKKTQPVEPHGDFLVQPENES
jgi:hypothetical protein